MFKLKITLLPLLIVGSVGIGGLVICRVLGVTPDYRALLMAATIIIAAAELAMVPVLIVNGKPADNVIQGALISTIVHMLSAAGGALLAMQLLHPPHAFLYWLCAFYWSTLAGVCWVLVKAVKAAPIPVAGPSTHLAQASEA